MIHLKRILKCLGGTLAIVMFMVLLTALLLGMSPVQLVQLISKDWVELILCIGLVSFIFFYLHTHWRD